MVEKVSFNIPMSCKVSPLQLQLNRSIMFVQLTLIEEQKSGLHITKVFLFNHIHVQKVARVEPIDPLKSNIQVFKSRLWPNSWLSPKSWPSLTYSLLQPGFWPCPGFWFSQDFGDIFCDRQNLPNEDQILKDAVGNTKKRQN